MLSLSACQADGGVYQGNDTICTGVGACCLADDTCLPADGVCCENQLGGSSQGFATLCGADEACCTPDGGCTMTSPVCCANELHGTSLGGGSTCAGVDVAPPDGFDDACPIINVGCCLMDGSCVEETAALCVADGGTERCACVGDNDIDGTDDVCEVCADLAIDPPLPEDAGLGSCTLDSDCTNEAVCRSSVCYVPKNRYISFQPDSPVGCIAFQVELTASTDFPECVGLKRWVGEPDPTTGVARLENDPLYREWTESVVSVNGQEIVPAATYEVRAVHQSCDPPDPADFSDPLDLPTVAVWGDTVGNYTGTGWTPPNGSADVGDILAVVRGFLDDATAPPVVQVDMGRVLTDAVIDGRDVLGSEAGLQGAGYSGESPCGVTAREAEPLPAEAKMTCQVKGKAPVDADVNSVRVIPGETVVAEVFVESYREKACSGSQEPCDTADDCPIGETCEPEADLARYQTNIRLIEVVVSEETGTLVPIDANPTVATVTGVDVEHKVCTVGGSEDVNWPCYDNSDCDPGEFCVENPRYVLSASVDAADTPLINSGALTAMGRLQVPETSGNGQLDGVPLIQDSPAYAASYTVSVSALAVPGSMFGVEILEEDEDRGSFLARSSEEYIPFVSAMPPPPACVLHVNPNCNENLLPDACDISCDAVACGDVPECGMRPDCNDNGIPDECEIDEDSTAPGGPFYCTSDCDPDCNNNGVPDACDVNEGTSSDCQPNEVPDECDLDAGTSVDCQPNESPDECDIADCSVPHLCGDCDGDGEPNECEADLQDQDCDGNGVCNADDIAGCPPDDPSCQDCQGNDIPDKCDIAEADGGLCAEEPCSADCQPNGIPDECDVAQGTSEDCTGNELPDECEAAPDCNGNGAADHNDLCTGESDDCNGNAIPDSCDIDYCGGDPDCGDCNANGVPDWCDIDAGTSVDSNDDGQPDECELLCYTGERFPTAGIDAGVTAEAAFEIRMLDDGAVESLVGLVGSSTILERGDPHFHGDVDDEVGEPCGPAPGFPDDPALGREVHLKIQSMEVANDTATVKVGTAYFDAVEGTPQEDYFKDSLGEAQARCLEFPSDGFFNVYAEIDTGVVRLYNKTPIVLRGELPDFAWDFAVPAAPMPLDRSFVLDATLPPTALFDENGVHHGYLVGARIGGSGLAETSCRVMPAVGSSVSFTVDDSAGGIGTVPNDVGEDEAAAVQQVTVYGSGAVPATWPDTTNQRFNDLIGQIGGGGGFLNGDAINSLSYGRDGTGDPGFTLVRPTVFFSVSTTSQGASCTDVASQASALETAADVYLARVSKRFGSYDAPSSPPCGTGGRNCLVNDQTSLGLTTRAGAPGRVNVTGLEVSAYTAGQLMYATFTGSSFLPGSDQRARIYVFDPALDFTLQNLEVYAYATDLGLGDGDEVRALALADFTPGADPQQPNGVLDVGLDEVLFTLAPGSPSLAGHSAADIFYSSFNGTHKVHVTADELGLAVTDAVDALDVGTTIPGNDCNDNAVDDRCDLHRGYSRDVDGSGSPDECEAKNRYVTFGPGNAGESVAFRVELVTSLDFPASVGLQRWVGEPRDPSCEDLETGEPLSGDPPCLGKVFIARLGGTPTYRVWDDVPYLHVRGCEIVPAARYEIRSIVEGADLENPANYSEAFVVTTTDKPRPQHWADCVGSMRPVCSGDGFTPCRTEADCPPGDACGKWQGPDGVANFDDVSAAVFAFQKVATTVWPDTVFVDVHGNNLTVCDGHTDIVCDPANPDCPVGDLCTTCAYFDAANYIPNFADIQQIVFGFKGCGYSFSDPQDCGQGCPCPEIILEGSCPAVAGDPCP